MHELRSGTTAAPLPRVWIPKQRRAAAARHSAHPYRVSRCGVLVIAPSSRRTCWLTSMASGGAGCQDGRSSACTHARWRGGRRCGFARLLHHNSARSADAMLIRRIADGRLLRVIKGWLTYGRGAVGRA